MVTDSLDMGAITHLYDPGDAMTLALDAGADIILDGVNMPGHIRPGAALAMHRTLVDIVSSGRVRGGEERIARSVERIETLFRTQPA